MIRPGFIHYKNVSVIYWMSREEPPAARHCPWHTPVMGNRPGPPVWGWVWDRVEDEGINPHRKTSFSPQTKTQGPSFLLGHPIHASHLHKRDTASGGRSASKTSAASRSQILPSLRAPCQTQVFLVHFKGYLETTHLSRNLRGSRQPGAASRSTPFDETFIFLGLKVLYDFPPPMTVLFPNTTPTREAALSERLSIPGREPGILPGRSFVLTAPHEGRSPVIVTGKVQCRWVTSCAFDGPRSRGGWKHMEDERFHFHLRAW